MSERGMKAYSLNKKKPRPFIRFRAKCAVFIAVVVFTACFLIYMAEANLSSKKANYNGFSADNSTLTSIMPTDPSESSEADESGAEKPTEKTVPTTQPKKNDGIINPVPESAPLTETYFGKCVFVGDSISVGLADYQLVPARNVFAELGMNIEKINTETMTTAYGEVTAIEALNQAKPENIYIMLGSNGIAWLSADEMTTQYSKFVDEIKTNLPESEIYILSIPPVTAERELSEEQPIQNTDVDEYNSCLLKMANEKKVHYVDINTALKGNDGKFPEDMAEKDGMHFVKSTYDVMLDYILSHTAK